MTSSQQDQRALGRRFLAALLLLTAALFFYMIRAFLVPLLLSAVFATLLFPLYRRLVGWLRGHQTAAALVCLLIFLVGLLAPLYAVFGLVIREAVTFYQGGLWRTWIDTDLPALTARLQAEPVWRDLGLHRIDWATLGRNAGDSAGQLAGAILERTSRGTLHAIINLFIMLFSMYYFFVDGERITRRLRRLSPLSEEHDAAIIKRFASVARATIRGTVVICLIQGVLGALTLWICRVPNPLLWGAVMLVLAFVPLIGVKLVLVPAGIYQIATGNAGWGIAILVISFVVILNVDNLLRPRLVGQDAGMHDVLIFVATLGGFAMFGATGFIVGPVIAAFLMSLLDIYVQEYGARAVPGAAPTAVPTAVPNEGPVVPAQP